MKPQLRERRSLGRYGFVVLIQSCMAQDPGAVLPLIQHQPGHHLGGSAHSIHVTHAKHSCLFVSGLVLPECVQGDDETQSNALNCDVIADYVQRISVWVQFRVNERSTRSISMAGFDQLIDNRCCLFCLFCSARRPGQAEPPLCPPGSLSNQSRTKQSQPGVWSPLGPVSDRPPRVVSLPSPR